MSCSINVLLVSMGLLCLATAHAGAQTPAPHYAVTELSPLPQETMSQAHAINDKGTVVGWSGSPARPNWATIWHDTLPTLPEKSEYYTIAEGINAAGVVVGSPTIVTGLHMGSTLSGASALSIWQDKTVYLPAFSNAHAINNAGQLAGDFEQQAAIWQPDARNRFLFHWHPIDAYPGYTGSDAYLLNAMSTAFAINDGGQAVGVLWSSHTHSDDNFRAFRLEAGKIVLLDTPKGGASAAYAISEDGIAAGMLHAPGAPDCVAIWPAQGPVKRLPSLPGLSSAAVFGMNNADLAVGCASHSKLPATRLFPFRASALPDDRAVLWQGGKAIDLTACLPPGSGWILQSARAINHAGQIVGFGLLNGKTRAFIAFMLTPAP